MPSLHTASCCGADGFRTHGALPLREHSRSSRGAIAADVGSRGSGPITLNPSAAGSTLLRLLRWSRAAGAECRYDACSQVLSKKSSKPCEPRRSFRPGSEGCHQLWPKLGAYRPEHQPRQRLGRAPLQVPAALNPRVAAGNPAARHVPPRRRSLHRSSHGVDHTLMARWEGCEAGVVVTAHAVLEVVQRHACGARDSESGGSVGGTGLGRQSRQQSQRKPTDCCCTHSVRVTSLGLVSSKPRTMMSALAQCSLSGGERLRQCGEGKGPGG